MCYRTAAVLLIGLLAIGAAQEAPGQEQAGKLYFPTTPGTKWVYDDGGKEETEEVTAVEKKKDGVVVTVLKADWTGGKRTAQLKVTPEGLFLLTDALGFSKHSPRHLLRVPHKDGQKWETDYGSMGENSTLTATGPEKVEVPAGKFEAIRVETTILDKATGGGPLKIVCWYAPGVGLVKRTYGDTTTVLKSFIPGKE